jgi:hypothetical protein
LPWLRRSKIPTDRLLQTAYFSGLDKCSFSNVSTLSGKCHAQHTDRPCISITDADLAQKNQTASQQIGIRYTVPVFHSHEIRESLNHELVLENRISKIR